MLELLQELKEGRCLTAGRYFSGPPDVLVNAGTRIEVTGLKAADGTLVRCRGRYESGVLTVESFEVVGEADERDEFPFDHFRGVSARSEMMQLVRDYFYRHRFLEVETPNMVAAAGTDPFIDAVSIRDGHSLHTSPEFAMKRLLAHGYDRIFQTCKVYRRGEVTRLHNPEFSILEFYRAWQGMETIIDDVEALVRLCVPGLRTTEFRRMTMSDLVKEACGIDLLENLDALSLRRSITERGLFVPREGDGWHEMFFELVVTRLDPFLATQPPTFVTHWPTQLAVLARRTPGDDRTALRFELYVGGLELCNGFEELTDPVEQRQRFEEDLDFRRVHGSEDVPMPEGFLRALGYGMPPSSGVAIGLDRLLMLRIGAQEIGEVLPFWWGRGVY